MSFTTIITEIKQNLDNVLEESSIPKVSFGVEPAKPGFGDVSSNVAFLLAKPLKKSPKDIAITLAEKYQKFLGSLITKVEPHPSGYLNFFVDVPKFNELILKDSIKDDYGFVNIGNGKKIIVEHTSVNPNKALHIGHVRNVIIGDSIARILKNANFDVKILNYVDDSGLQVADIILGFKHLGYSENPPDNQKFDHYCGDVVYVNTTEQYEKNPDLEEKRKEVLSQLEDESSEIAKFADIITGRVLECQLQTCWNLGAEYDCLNFESQIIRSGLWAKTFEELKKKELVTFQSEGKNAGCWVIPSFDNEEEKVIVRSNGTATYIAKDIPYASWKLGLLEDPFNYKKYHVLQPGGITLWQTTLEKTSKEKKDFQSDKVITVIDSRQSRLQKIITRLMSDFKSEPDVYIHLSYESVTLSPDTANSLGIDTKGKQAQMSGRKGLYVSADSVLELLKNKTLDETKNRNPNLGISDLKKISSDVAVGALRYEMIKQDLDKIISFDLTNSLSLEGDTAPYVQYTFARASRILEKSQITPNFDAQFNLLDSEYEVNLIKLIGQFDSNVTDAAKNLSPKVIAKYCHELAVVFNSFYEHVKVLEQDNKSISNARLCLVFSFKKTLEKALSLIGINAPSRM
jgi:arginyl-tRNA synthetase